MVDIFRLSPLQKLVKYTAYNEEYLSYCIIYITII